MEQNKVNSLDQKSAGSWCADPTKADRLSTQTLPNRLKSHCSCSAATSWQQSGGASLLASSPLWSFDRLKGQRGRRRGRKDGGGQLYFQMLPTCFASLAWMDANYFFFPLLLPSHKRKSDSGQHTAVDGRQDVCGCISENQGMESFRKKRFYSVTDEWV